MPDLIGADNPSWVFRTHLSFPQNDVSVLIRASEKNAGRFSAAQRKSGLSIHFKINP